MTDIDTQIESLINKMQTRISTAYNKLDDNSTSDEWENYSDERDRAEREAHKAIKTLLDTAVQEARIELATDLLRKVKLEYEAGGRYSGHIILPWEEVVRPELVKLKSTSKEDK